MNRTKTPRPLRNASPLRSLDDSQLRAVAGGITHEGYRTSDAAGTTQGTDLALSDRAIMFW